MRNIEQTNLWEVNIHLYPFGDRFEFSIKVYYNQTIILGIVKQKHIISDSFSEISLNNYIYLTLPLSTTIYIEYLDKLREFLCHIVNTVSTENVNEGLQQLNALTNRTNLPKGTAIFIDRWQISLDGARFLFQDIKVNEKNAAACCYMLYLMIAELYSISRGVIMDSGKALQILLSCRKKSTDNVPSTYIRRVGYIMQYLCKSVYKEEASLLILLEYSYELLGNEVFLELIESSFDKRRSVLPLYQPTKQFDFTHLLVRLYHFALENQGTVPLIERIFRHLPYSQHVAFITEMRQFEKRGDLMNTIMESLSYKPGIQMMTYGREGNLESLLETWNGFIELFPESSKSLNDFGERAILTFLTVANKTISVNGVTKLFQLVRKTDIFTTTLQQLNLFNSLSHSKNHDLLNMAIDLLNQTKYCNLEKHKMGDIISVLFVHLLQDCRDRASTNEKDAILTSYQYFDKITSTAYVKHHEDIHEKLEEFIFKFMQKYELKTMIEIIPEIEDNTKWVEIYVAHITSFIIESYPGRTFDEIIKDICGTSTLTVNSRQVMLKLRQHIVPSHTSHKSIKKTNQVNKYELTKFHEMLKEQDHVCRYGKCNLLFVHQPPCNSIISSECHREYTIICKFTD